MVCEPVTAAELEAALPHIGAAPRDAAPIAGLCLRPGFGERTFPDLLRLTRAEGVPGERWATLPWLRLPDGRPDPAIQVSILPLRVLDLVWRDRGGTVHPGDNIIADLACSTDNLPEGSLIGAGSAVLRVSGVFNEGCVKWKARYGAAAKDWITAGDHPALRLRGIYCAVERDGEVRLSDRLQILRRGA